jgi:uncharacterized 2Fe-2S/4Fe-4S cluster protein (DUF4445 family)
MNSTDANNVKAMFLPEEREVEAKFGTTILDAATVAGVHVETICSGRGTCGKCRVLIKGYDPPLPTWVDNRRLSPTQLNAGWRMACEHPLIDGGTYTHPLVEQHLRTVESTDIGEITLRPNVQKHAISITKPNLTDTQFDWPRVQDELAGLAGGVDTSVTALRKLPGVMSGAGEGPITVTLVGNRAIDFEQGDTSDVMFGLAFDIGTTSVVGALVDLNNGSRVSIAAELNGQAMYGGDVISRTSFAGEDPGNIDKLRIAVLETINGIIDQLVKQARTNRKTIYECVFVGNTVMMHLLTGLDPGGIGVSPFVGVSLDPMTISASDLELNLEPATGIYLTPSIAGYVGADVVGVMISTELQSRSGNVLVIDVGTNGEIALKTTAGVLCTAAPAGPAFEGAEIRQGMRAVDGAIERVSISNSKLELGVIGNVHPTGICGSGLVDAVAELLKLGIVNSAGRLLPPDELPANIPLSLRERVFPDDEGGEFLLAGTEPGDADSVSLHAQDIRQLQLAKASIRAGVDVLLEQANLQPKDLSEVLLAGAFGTYLAPKALLAIGMVPPISEEIVEAVGNAAGLGARMLLLSLEYRVAAELLAGNAEYVELSAVQDFQWIFARAMSFAESAEF